MSSRQPMRREPISLAIKNDIRLHHKENERMTVGDMVLWAEKRYGIPFLPATMRTILFPKPSKSGTLSTQLTCTERQRERNGNWPELEIELAGWYKSCTTPPKGEEMTAKAKELWQDLAPKYYNGQKQPTFGVNWRDKFKARHGLKLKKVSGGVALINGELPSVNAQQRHNLLDNNSPTDANISLHADDDVLEIPMVESLSNAFAGLDYSENATLLDFSGELRSVIPGDLEDKTSHPTTLQSPNTSRRSIELTGDEAQDSTLEAFASAWQRIVSTSPRPWLQSSSQTVAPNCAGRADVTEGVSSKRASEDDGNRRRSKGKYRDPYIVGNSMPPSKLQDERRPRPQFLVPLPFCDPERNRTIRECISSLLLKAPNGDQSVSGGSVECLIKALASELEVRDSPDFQQAYQSTLCPYHKVVQNRIEANRPLSVKALKLLQLAETIKVQSPPRKDWSEWETELLFYKFFRFPSQDRDSEECDKVVSSDLNHNDVKRASCVPQFQFNHGRVQSISKNADSIFTMKSKQARVDIISSTFAMGKDPDAFGITAQVILTLPSTAQMLFYLPPTTTSGYNSSLMPSLSIRKMIPSDSEVFEIAARGTVEELRELFSEGKASLVDCDEDGRSLINYALTSYNVEVFCYLINFISDVDTYEVSELGYIGPLIAVMTNIVSEMPEDTRERRTECFKKMLDMGADCTLQTDKGDGLYISILQNELLMGENDIVEAILNSEHSLTTPNSLGDAKECQLSPICSLAEYFRGQTSELFQVFQKFKILIERGADVNYRDFFGRTCLHFVLSCDTLYGSRHSCWDRHDHDEFKSILMALITAGGDVKAIDENGISPSDMACSSGNEEVWIQALADCGYNPWEIVLFDNEYLKEFPGINIFSSGKIKVRPTKLSFKEFLSHAEHLEAAPVAKVIDTGVESELMMSLAFGEVKDDSDSECWSDSTSCCACSTCADNSFDDDARYSQENEYAPINGDPSWLAYIPQSGCLTYTYWIDYSSEWSGSSNYEYLNGDEDVEGDNEEYDEEDMDELESEYEGEDESDCEGEEDMDEWESEYEEEYESDCEDED